MEAIIAGATGLIGKELMFKLLENQNVSKVTILIRKELTISHPKLIQKVIDFEKIHTVSVTENADFFCCLGTTIKKAKTKEEFIKVDFEYVVNFGKLAQKNNAKSFNLVSALGANENSIIFYNRVKGKTEKEIINLNIKNTKIYRPSILEGNRKEFRLGEFIALKIMKLLGVLFIGRFKKYKITPSYKLVEKLIINTNIQNEKPMIIENDNIIQ
jgi:uncharacterized protein YbjT (DUF2867 family)